MQHTATRHLLMHKYVCNMEKVNLSQAAKIVGKNRTTIWRHINAGKLSYERDRDGMPHVDTSELIRVYGELKQVATEEVIEKPHNATPSYYDLLNAINLLRKEQAEMKEQIVSLTNRLSYTAPLIDETNPKKVTKAEDDPDWPKVVSTLDDIKLRNDIRAKYKP